uniref:NADH dehydrogenase subunit 4L n=1 Tax=Thaumatoptyx sp. RM-2016 TaxID=1885857 RepID=A0A224ABT1_9EUPU|nr:NADH dehydrogenase subunit 4L [Thaumatoptyx sp. RM-2016]
MLKMTYFLLLLLLLLYLVFFSVSNHFLSSLIILESMVLILLLFSLCLVSTIMEGMAIYLWVLTLSVCEAAMGLTLLISLLKIQGSDTISNYIG